MAMFVLPVAVVYQYGLEMKGFDVSTFFIVDVVVIAHPEKL
jgi:hypothetical protein